MRLFRITKGYFHFKTNEIASGAKIICSLTALLLEGLRQNDEFNRLKNQIPLYKHVKVKENITIIKSSLQPEEISIIEMLRTGPLSIFALMEIPAFTDLQILYGLEKLKNLQILDIY